MFGRKFHSPTTGKKANFEQASIYDHALSHPIPEERQQLKFGKRDASPGPTAIAAARRLIVAYQATVAQTDTPLKSITDADLWTGITRENFAVMIDFIERADAEELARFLSDFGSTYTWFGGVTTGLDGYNHWDTTEQSVAYSYFDKLVCLAEGLGVLSCENPEQGMDGNWGRNIRLDPDSVADRIAAHLSIDIVPPMGVIPVAGLELRNGLLHYRHINALYLAARIKDLTDPGDRICEFGAGLGLAAFYLHKMGWTDSTLFDIPLTNVLSGHFLIGALGPNAVCLEGEIQRPGTVKILANWNCTDVPDRYFRLVANQDSFPEINHQALEKYLNEISRCTDDFFLSINHEVEHQIREDTRHLNVSKLLHDDQRFAREYRAPYWIRRGYVEELYRIVHPTSTEATSGTSQ